MSERIAVVLALASISFVGCVVLALGGNPYVAIIGPSIGVALAQFIPTWWRAVT